MKNVKFLLPIALIFYLFVSNSCVQEAPKFGKRTGDSLFFSGRFWTIKKFETSLMGPGPNYFSTNPNHVWVDNRDQLHMTISQANGKWFATEIVSTDTMGYGTYTFTVLGDFKNMPENVTLGLFTWDDNTFYEAANSEVDIEFSKWGDTNSVQSLNYAVQPVAFGPVYEERAHNEQLENPDVLIGTSTHEFTWAPDKITWRSYTGSEAKDENKIAEWAFTSDMPGRIKYENGQSSVPVVIPKPGRTTNARINFWLQTWISDGPAGGQEQEVIITKFEYQPL